mmetsp:Transcript_14284/g.30500  ORF Transcript_14284/g.30500 Transcript_14284/m.30500 type:complete len:467 (-) Transcript_14284:391-1791(-)
MRRNSNKPKRSTSRGGAMPYNRMRSVADNIKRSQLNSIVRKFPSSRRTIKTTSSEQGGAFPDDSSPSRSTVASSENDGSINHNEAATATTTPATDPNISTVISYQDTEVIECIPARKSTTRRSVLSPVKEDRSVQSSVISIDASAKNDKGGGGGWVGIGFDGEALALSVCSETSSVGHSSNREQYIPNAIDFNRFESDNLPIVEEDKISAVNGGSFINRQSVAQRVLQEVEDLSVDLGVLEDIDSISSVMTKDDAIDLAQRLEMMERQLLELAGETGKVDALRALAKATHNQTRKADSLQRKVRSQEKKITTLTDLCQRLLDRKQQDNALRSTTEQEVVDLKNSRDELTLELHRSESRAEALSEKLRQLEEENAHKSYLLRHSHSEKKSNNQTQVKFNELLKESRRRAEEDRATIKRLELEMKTMAAAHTRSEKRSKSKIGILIEMKCAMEEQIRLLEGNDSSSEE